MPSLASNNTTQLRYIPEATFGVIPGAGNAINLRHQGESLTFDRTKESDKEINATGELTSATTVDAGASGDIKIHMQYAEYDKFIAGVLRSAWVAFGTNGVGATFSGTFAANTITAGAATSGTSIFTSLKKGQWFRLVAPTNANDGKLLRVSTTTAPTTTVITVDASTPLVAGGSGVANCAIQTSRLTNGVTLSSFTIERDTGVGEYFAYRGMTPSKLSLSFKVGMTEGSISFLGKDYIRGGVGAGQTGTRLPGSPVASNAYDVHNGISGISKVWEGGVPLASTFIQEMTLDVDSGLRAQKAIGNLGLVGVGIGTFMVKGTLQIYFADGALFTKFENDTYTSFIVSTQDSSGNGYVLTFPKVQLTKASVMAGSKDADLLASFEYTAYKDLGNADTSLAYTMFIDRVGVAVP